MSLKDHRLARWTVAGLAAVAFAVPAASTSARPVGDGPWVLPPTYKSDTASNGSSAARGNAPYVLPSTFQSDRFTASDRQRVRAFEASHPAPPVQVVKAGSDGFDWGDAAIGGGSVLGLTLLCLGGAMAVLHRRNVGVKGARTA